MISLWIPKYNVDISDPCCYPLGAMYISAVLRQAGYAVTVYNNNLAPYTPRVLYKSTVVLFTGFDEFINENIIISNSLRKIGIRTVLGGAYATFETDEASKYFDAVVIGEGEGSILSALVEDGIHSSAPLNIDSIPWPDYEGFGIKKYHDLHITRYMGTLTSRGCPHSCTFCSSVCSYRIRSIENVIEEIKFYKFIYDIECIIINDNTLNVTEDRFVEFSEAMLPIGIKWTAALRLDKLSSKILDVAKKSGLCYAVIGVESLDQSVLDRYNKKITVEQVLKGIEIVRESGIGYTGNLLVETESEFYSSLPIAKKYGLFPTGIKKFVGNKVKDAPHQVHNLCRKYAVSEGRTYAA